MKSTIGFDYINFKHKIKKYLSSIKNKDIEIQKIRTREGKVDVNFAYQVNECCGDNWIQEKVTLNIDDFLN